MTFGDFDTYIKNLCVLHKKVNHTVKDRHYFDHGLDEILTGLQKEVNYPYISREKGDYKYYDNGSDSVFKKREVALNFIHHITDTTDFQLKQQKEDELEVIIDDFLNQMNADRITRKHSFLKDFNFNSVEVISIPMTVNSDFGFFVKFEITNYHNFNVDLNNWNG